MAQMVRLGISRPTAWNLLENKVANINHTHVEKICELLNCTTEDIAGLR